MQQLSPASPLRSPLRCQGCTAPPSFLRFSLFTSSGAPRISQFVTPSRRFLHSTPQAYATCLLARFFLSGAWQSVFVQPGDKSAPASSSVFSFFWLATARCIGRNKECHPALPLCSLPANRSGSF